MKNIYNYFHQAFQKNRNLVWLFPQKPMLIGAEANGSCQKWMNLFFNESPNLWGCFIGKLFFNFCSIENKPRLLSLSSFFPFAGRNGAGAFLGKKLNFYLMTVLFLLFNSALAQNIQVSGAGSTQVNGIYEVTGESQGKPSYTKVGDPTVTIIFNDYWEIRENPGSGSATLYRGNTLGGGGNTPVSETSWALLAGTASTPTVTFFFFAGGDGSEGDPYQIANWTHLSNMRYYLSAHFILNNNLDNSTSDYIGLGDNWNPIGDSENRFSGSFDGNDKKISKLTINSSSSGSFGLFGTTNGAHIFDLDLLEIDISVMQGVGVGGLVGSARGGSDIERIFVSGEVEGFQQVGGVVGNLLNSTSILRDVTANVSVSGTNSSSSSNIGGVVGFTQAGRILIERVVSLGDVTLAADGAIGGLLGFAKSFGPNEPVTVKNSYSTGKVTGRQNNANVTQGVGGFIGRIDSKRVTIENCFSSGVVAKGRGNIGGFAGFNNGGTVKNSFWNITVNSDLSSTAGIAKTETELKTQATFVGWDFDAIWSINPEGYLSYPYLQAIDYDTPEAEPEVNPIPGLEVLPPFAGGDGSEGDPYQIEDWTHLNNVRNHLDAHFILNNDLDENTSDYIGIGDSWVPIGGVGGLVFTGSLNGNGKKISNLVINSTEAGEFGFFGEIEGAHIFDLDLIDCSITVTGTLSSSVGGLVGRAESSSLIELVYVSGSVEGYRRVGGIIGRILSDNSVLRDAIANVSVSGTNDGSRYIGGAVGVIEEGSPSIERVLSLGNVTLENAVTDTENGAIGGLVGFADDDAIVRNSYSMGNVTGPQLTSRNNRGVGGFIGRIDNRDVLIENCFSYGTVTTGQGNIGGFVGANNGGTVKNSFWNSTANSGLSSAAGTAKTETELMLASTYLSAGWDSDIWSFAGGRGSSVAGYELALALPYLTDVTRQEDIIEGNTFLLFAGGWGGLTDAEQAGADGSAYGISDWNQLQNMKFLLDQGYDFELANDLTPQLSGYAEQVKDGATLANGGTGWMPLSNSSQSTNFTFDGKDHKITGLIINREDSDSKNNLGIFGFLSGSASDQVTIRNVSIIDAAITGSNSLGVLVGNLRTSALLEDIHVQGKVTGTGQSLGGMVGYMRTPANTTNFIVRRASADVTVVSSENSDLGGLIGHIDPQSGTAISIIEDSWSIGNVSGRSRLGGLVGDVSNRSLLIQRSFAKGNVISTSSFTSSMVGGLIGRNRGDINSSFATGNVAADQEVGGLVGNAENDQVKITNAYATGNVLSKRNDGFNPGAGGLVGRLNSGIEITNSYATGEVTVSSAGWQGGSLVGEGGATINSSYWNNTINSTIQGTGGETASLPTDPAGLVGKTTAELNTQATFVDWDFDDIWSINPEGYLSYPYLQAIDYDTPEAEPEVNPIPGLRKLQEITFDPLGDKTYGDEDFDLIASTSSDLSLTFESSDSSIAIINGNKLSIVGVGTVTITASQLGNDSYATAEPVEQELTINKKELTVTGLRGNDKEYDGTTDATVTGDAELEGVVDGDNVILDGTPVFTFADANVAEDITINTTGYEISGDASGNYKLSQPELSADITPAILALIAVSVDPIADQTYTGSAIEPGVVVKEGSTTLVEDTDYTLSFSDNINVGEATVTVTGKGNYSGTQDAKFNIVAKASSTLMIESISDQTYTGSAIEPAVVVKDGSTTLTLDTDYELSFSDNTNVGEATVTVTGKGNYSGTQDAKFNIVAKASSTLMIDPIADQTYTGSAIEPTVVVKDGSTTLVEDTDYTLSFSDNINVGEATVTVTGKGNYSGITSKTFMITKAALTITADDRARTYGFGTPALTFTYEGLVNGDTRIEVEPTISTPATDSSPAGIYPIELSGGSDPNYEIELVNGELIIGRKALTITADDRARTYGFGTPALTFRYEGLVNGDTRIEVEPTISTPATDSSPAGIYPIELSGGSDPNYEIELVNGELIIGRKALTIRADDKQKDYGEENPTLTFAYDGLVNGDTQINTEPSIATTATASSNVGSYPITLTGGADQNYAITLVDGTLTIGKKALTITAEDKQKTYGEANPELTFTYDGLTNGDTKVATEPSIATTATASSNVGSYPITLTGGADQNYAITLVDGTLTIGKKDLTITADDKQKVYGEANPALTFTYSGLVNGDTKVSTEPSISTAATASSNVGQYPIELTGGADQNYTITLVDGTLTVGKKDLTIRAEDKQKTYGEANPELTFAYDGLVNGDTKVATEPSIATAATASSNVGSYPITLTGAEDQNYAITLVDGTLTIGKKDLTIIADEQEKIFGREDPELSFRVDGLTAGDGLSVVSGSLIRQAGEEVGVYAILQGTLEAGPNYQISFIGASLEIVPARLSAVLNPELLRTPWSVLPALPETVRVLTADGQEFEISVSWNLATLDVFRRGLYFVNGTLALPTGILNDSDVKAVQQVEVLPKPAPLDVTLSNNVFVGEERNFFITVGAFTVIDPVDDIHEVTLLGEGYDNGFFEIKDNLLFWSSADRAEGRTSFTIIVQVTDRDGNTLEKFFEISRTRKAIESIEVYNAFTPNGDGINDIWGVPGIRFFSGARIQVFDRSGERVFYTEDPDAGWDGTYKGRELPTGAYTWVLEVKETGEKRMGILNLIRQ